MTDFEWIQEFNKEYHPDETPPCGTGEGCGTLFIILGIAFVVIQFVLPFFGIEFDIFDFIRRIFQ